MSEHELMPKTWRTRLDIWWQHHPTSPKRWAGRLKQKAGYPALEDT